MVTRTVLRPSFPGLAFSGAFVILYGYSEYAGAGLAQENVALLSMWGSAVWILFVLLFALGAGSAILQLKERAREASTFGATRGFSVLGEPFLHRRGHRVFLAAFSAYLLVFSWASSILVIRPGQDFTATYGVQVPSTQASVCCGPVGTVPSYTIFLMQGLGLLLIPANVLLALSVSLLAALSISVSISAFSTWRAASRGAGSAGLAGLVGFVASCPTCAGQVLLGAILGSGSSAFALAVAPWQLDLALASIGILLVTLWAQTRWIARSRRACVVRATPREASRIG